MRTHNNRNFVETMDTKEKSEWERKKETKAENSEISHIWFVCEFVRFTFLNDHLL